MDTAFFDYSAPVYASPVFLHLKDSARKTTSARKIGTASLDKSAKDIGVYQVWDGTGFQALKGEGVIVGVYDSGIDWNHPDFIDAEGHSRILFLWDQTDTTGISPDPFGYGSEYTNEQINDAITGISTGIVRGRDVWGHGTHIAGIAAGNGRATGNGKDPNVYIGMAPESDLIIVKGGDTHFYSDWILDGLQYIFCRAASMNPPKPVSVNLSVGRTHFGSHDGTSIFERGIDSLLLYPGRAVIIAAGNEGDDAIHFKGNFSSQGDDSLVVRFGINQNHPQYKDYVLFDIWYHDFSALSVILITPSGHRYGPVSPHNSGQWKEAEGQFTIRNDGSPDQDYEVTIRIEDEPAGDIIQDDLAVGEWKLLIKGHPGRFDGWLYESSMDARLLDNADYSTLLAEPANTRLGITVGSYITREQWPSLFQDPWGPGGLETGQISAFSSPGPTRISRDNTQPLFKPEITAPGEYILSSMSRDTYLYPSAHFIASDSAHRAWSGTSMAAPHVTGVVALMFQADSSLTSSQIKARLIQSARKDEYTGPDIWNQNWGYGKLDAYEAVRLATAVKSQSDTPRLLELYQNYPNPFNHTTMITFYIPYSKAVNLSRIHLIIHDLNGRIIKKLFNSNLPPGEYTMLWDGSDETGQAIASGIYIIHMISEDAVFSRKCILMK